MKVNIPSKTFMAASPNQGKFGTGQAPYQTLRDGTGQAPHQTLRDGTGQALNQTLCDGTGQASGANRKARKKRVFVAMSGGVDSSVAAALLKNGGFSAKGGPPPKADAPREQVSGWDVTGVHIKCFNLDGCGDKEAEDARRAAEVLGIPFYVWDFEKEYKDNVVEYMVDGYRRGITPNPDVMCNKEIKFGLFLKKALAMGADYVATGHYVRLVERPARYFYGNQNNFAPAAKFSSPSPHFVRHASDTKQNAVAGCSLRNSGQFTPKIFSLLTAKDKNKDQSYFLWTLTQKQLKRCLFPIGEYTKPQVRRLAKKFCLPNAEKKDSQGICFLGQVALKDFLKEYIPEKKGIVLDTSGQIVGEHKGAHFYTIGQRHIGCANRGLAQTRGGLAQTRGGLAQTRGGLAQTRGGLARTKNFKPLYVAEKDAELNALLVAEENSPVLYKKEIKLKNVNFIHLIPSLIRANGRMSVLARVRYRQPLKPALLVIHNSSFKLVFSKPVKFVAPGQSAVFYNSNGEILGGGIIA